MGVCFLSREAEKNELERSWLTNLIAVSIPRESCWYLISFRHNYLTCVIYLS